ncbi:hypothetical protein BH10PAT3_BH10PAT3_2450 [soil metagenome]
MSETLNLSNTPETNSLKQELVNFYDLNRDMAVAFGASDEAQTPEQLAEFARYYAREDGSTNPWEAADEIAGDVNSSDDIWHQAFSGVLNEEVTGKSYTELLDELHNARTPHEETVLGLTESGKVSKVAKTITVEVDKTKADDLFDELAGKLAGSGMSDDGLLLILSRFNEKLDLNGDEVSSLIEKIYIARDEAEMASELAAAEAPEIDPFQAELDELKTTDEVTAKIRQMAEEAVKSGNTIESVFGDKTSPNQNWKMLQTAMGQRLNTETKSPEERKERLAEIQAEITKIYQDNGNPVKAPEKKAPVTTEAEKRAEQVAAEKTRIAKNIENIKKAAPKADINPILSVLYKDEKKKFGKKGDFDKTIVGEAFWKQAFDEVATKLGVTTENYKEKKDEFKSRLAESKEFIMSRPTKGERIKNVGRAIMRIRRNSIASTASPSK